MGAYDEDEIQLYIETCMDGAERNPNQFDEKRVFRLPSVGSAEGRASMKAAECVSDQAPLLGSGA